MARRYRQATWGRQKPESTGERRALAARKGARRRCFLDPKRLRYPICPKTGPAKRSCDGLRYAYARARQQHEQTIAKRARAIACRMGCPWTERKGCP